MAVTNRLTIISPGGNLAAIWRSWFTYGHPALEITVGRADSSYDICGFGVAWHVWHIRTLLNYWMFPGGRAN